MNIIKIIFITFFLFSFNTMALNFDPDVEPAVKTQFLNDLNFLKSIQSGGHQGNLNKEIFGSAEGKNYLNWFLSRVDSVGKNLCFGDPAVACVLSAWENKIWLSPNYTKYNQPQIARLMVLIHEARHTEFQNKHWPHVTCPKDFPYKSIWTGASLAGEAACDIDVKGSYGTAAVFLKNVAKYCTQCSDQVRSEAQAFAEDQILRQRDPKDQAALHAE